MTLVLSSCSKSNDPGDGGDGGNEVLDPAKATLKFPNNNEECTGGVVISNTEAKITFDWNKAENTTSYTLFIKNLDSDIEESFAASTNKLEVTIERATPYAWHVVSKSDTSTKTATSDTWKFYLAGVGIESYAPFPADVKSPEHEASITGNTVTLEWIGNDVDDDIKEYDIYMDTNTIPTTKLATVSVQKLENQTVTTNTTYYWKVVTHDTVGNTSTSNTFSFSVQ